MDASGIIMAEHGTKLVKYVSVLIVVLGFLLTPPVIATAYYGNFYGDLGGSSNLPPSGIITNGGSAGQVLANLGNGKVGFTNAPANGTNGINGALPVTYIGNFASNNPAIVFNGSIISATATNTAGLWLTNFSGTAGSYSINVIGTMPVTVTGVSAWLFGLQPTATITNGAFSFTRYGATNMTGAYVPSY